MCTLSTNECSAKPCFLSAETKCTSLAAKWAAARKTLLSSSNATAPESTATPPAPSGWSCERSMSAVFLRFFGAGVVSVNALDDWRLLVRSISEWTRWSGFVRFLSPAAVLLCFLMHSAARRASPVPDTLFSVTPTWVSLTKPCRDSDNCPPADT